MGNYILEEVGFNKQPPPVKPSQIRLFHEGTFHVKAASITQAGNWIAWRGSGTAHHRKEGLWIEQILWKCSGTPPADLPVVYSSYSSLKNRTTTFGRRK